MSTCQGSPPPHNNCPHGEACDWIPPFDAKAMREAEAKLREQFPQNRQGRRALERALKKRNLR